MGAREAEALFGRYVLAVVLYISYGPVVDDCRLFMAKGGRDPGEAAAFAAAFIASCLDFGPRTWAMSWSSSLQECGLDPLCYLSMRI